MDRQALRAALTPTWRSAGSKLVWTLRAWLALLLAIALLVDPKYTTRGMLVQTVLWGFAASVAFAFIPTHRPRTLRAAEAAVLAAFALHVMGHVFGWYDAWPDYDTVLHFTVPMATALVFFGLSQATRWIWDWREIDPLQVAIYTFAMTVTVGVFWEIVEFGSDRLLGTREQDGLEDTMIDLIADVSGAALGATCTGFITRHGRRHGFHEISERPAPETPRSGPRRGGA